MSKTKAHPKQMRQLSVRKMIAVGLILLVLAVLISGHKKAMDTKNLAVSTMDTLKQQCTSFNKLVAADRTKSLFHLTELMQNFNDRLADEPNLAQDAFLEQYVDSLRVSGIALLDENLKLEASGHTRRFQNSDWLNTPDGNRFSDIIRYPAKIYAERVEVRGEYYDVCAMARKDAPGILIGFYQQPSGLISGTENDLESLLSGLHLEGNGHYVIAEDGKVRATSDPALEGRRVSDNAVLRQLSQIEKDAHLQLISADGSYYWGYRSACEGYLLYIYYPALTVFSVYLVTAAVFAAVYLLLCFAFFAMRNRVLYENQEKLKESNRQLSETVEMLKSLETIYFCLFYVNLEENTYSTIYLAPWLKDAVAQEGVYTELKKLFLDNMIVPAYREEVDQKMSNAYIQETLSQENITDARKSFYTDYQAIRGSEIRWCRVSATVVDYDEAGKPVHVLALLQDVDKEKRKEAEYQQKILKEAQEAKVANLAKTEFLRRISHDIRTPINGIQGYIERSAKHPEDIALQEHCRESAAASLHTLMSLVNDVLDMSKLESNSFFLEEIPFDLTKLLEEVNTILRPQAASRKIRYEVMGDIAISHLIGSPRHVTQIIMNIAGNAVKYGKAGGYIHVTTQMLSHTDETVTYAFTCADDGIGMSKEFQERMFEPFTQEGVNARTTYEGTGLGLSITKKLVDALGGRICCQSEKGKGTTFRIELTFRIDTEQRDTVDAASEVDTEALRGKRVLLAEDNALNMEIAEFMLTEYGVSVTKVWNGQEAVDAFAASEIGFYDFILMDIMMPVMDGLTATGAIRAMERADAKTVLIAAMSANAFSEDIKNSLDAGMDAHISKPVEEKKMIAVMTKLLALREERKKGE